MFLILDWNNDGVIKYDEIFLQAEKEFSMLIILN